MVHLALASFLWLHVQCFHSHDWHRNLSGILSSHSFFYIRFKKCNQAAKVYVIETRMDAWLIWEWNPIFTKYSAFIHSFVQCICFLRLTLMFKFSLSPWRWSSVWYVYIVSSQPWVQSSVWKKKKIIVGYCEFYPSWTQGLMHAENLL